MKLIKLLATTTVMASILFSCSKDESDTQTNEQPVAESSVLSNAEVTNLAKLGFIPQKTQIVDFELPDGTIEKYYQFEDMRFPVSAINSLDNVENKLAEYEQAKLFTSTARAAGNRTYRVAFVDFNAPFQRQAAGDLVFLFNRLGSTVQLSQVFINGSQFGSTQADIFVFYQRSPIGGATAEFPSNNRPGRFLSIDPRDPVRAGIANRGGLRTLLLHEMGHQFGFRHSDFRAIGEPDSTGGAPGARHAPGTDFTGTTTNSIMVSGFTLNGDLSAGPQFYTQEDINGYIGVYGRR